MLPLAGVNYSEILLDEICLEGLDGITFQTLWIRLADRFGFEVSEKIKKRFWNIIVQFKDVDFYMLPVPRRPYVLFHRFTVTNGIFDLNDNSETDDIYTFHPVKEDHGSCEHFKTRKNVTTEARALSLEECLKRWGDSLVIVGKFEVRWAAMASSVSLPLQTHLNDVQYCLLEKIARSRYNGELTSGKNSLVKLDDPKTLFYHRKILTKLGLITRKNVGVPRTSSFTTMCLLLRLKRFSLPVKMSKDWVFSEIINRIQNKPNRVDLVSELKPFILSLDPTVPVRKFIKTQHFLKYFTIDHRVPYREVYPDATEKEWKIPNSDNERLLHGIRVKDDQVIDEEHDDNNDDEMEPKEGASGSCLLGENILYQMYQLIREAGQEGLAKSELSDLTGLDHLSVRLLTKHLVTSGVVQVTMHDYLKQRTAKYTSQEFTCNITKTLEKEKGKMVALKEKSTDVTSDNLNDSIKSEATSEKFDIHNAERSSTSTPVNLSNSSPSAKSKNPNLMQTGSLRIIRRANLIMEQVKKRHVILSSQFLGELTRLEANEKAVHGTMDRRSLYRILEHLEREGQLRLLKIKVDEKKSQLLTFICEPHIEDSDPIIQSVIEQVKIRIVTKAAEDRRKLSKNFLSHHGVTSVKNTVKIGRLHGYMPKMARMRILHEYLYYLCYSHKGKVGVMEDLLPKSALVDKELCKMIGNVYENAPDKYLFVPPVCKNVFRQMPQGWVFLSDIIFSMPLCVFLNIVNIGYTIPGLMSYVDHPIKSQILIKNLPEDLRADLFYKERYVASIRSTADRLCLIGLIKFGEQIGLKRCRVFMYLNRKTCILDTTPSCRGYNTIENRTYSREHFSFENMDDVRYYWDRLQFVCSNTKLGYRYASLGQEVEYHTPEVKMMKDLREYTVNEIVEDEYIPGDGLGAAGFDTTMFSHIKGSWEYVTSSIAQIKPVKRKQLTVAATAQDVCPRKKPRLARNPAGSRIANAQKGKFSVRTLLPRKDIVKKKPREDELDAQIIKNSTRARVTWSPEEDRVLLLTRAAATMMFNFLQVVPQVTVRDILHAATNLKEKTIRACQRRILFILRNPVVARTVQLYQAEANRNRVDLSKYTEFMATHRVSPSSPKFAEYDKQLKIRFIELTMFLHQMMHFQNAVRSVVIPNTISEIKKNFNIDHPEKTYVCKETEPKSSTEVMASILQSIIHSCLCCAGYMRSRNIQLLQLYRNFPESVLRQVIQKLRSSGMMSLKKHLSQFSLSHSYTSHLLVNIPYKIFVDVFRHVSETIHGNSPNLMLESLDSGAVALINEMMYTNHMTLSLNIPDSFVIDLANVSREKSFETTFKSSKSPVNSLQIVESNDFNLEGSVISCSEVAIDLNCPVAQLKDEYDVIKTKLIILATKLTSDGILAVNERDEKGNLYNEEVETLPCNVELAKKVVAIIDEFADMGAFTSDVKNKLMTTDTFYDTSELLEVFQSLLQKNIIKRVGNVDSLWVLRSHHDFWFVGKLPDIIPNYKMVEARPELTQSGSLNIHYSHTEDNEMNFEDVEDTVGANIITPKEDNSNNTEERENNDILNQTREILGDNMNYDMEQISNKSTTTKPISESDIPILGDIKYLIDISAEKQMLKVMNTSNFANVKNNVLISPRPWIRVDGGLNLKVLWPWIRAIVLYLVDRPMLKLSELHKRFHYMAPFHIRLLVEISSEIGCTKLVKFFTTKASLWSEGSNFKIEPVSMLDDNDVVRVDVLENHISLLAMYQGTKLST